jgi:hypothetical protein
LYYSQRIVTYPTLRRLVVRALSAAVRLRQGAGRNCTPPRRRRRGPAGPAPQRLRTARQSARRRAVRRHPCLAGDKLLIDRDRQRSGFTLAQRPEAVRVADYHLRDVIACPHILALANSRRCWGWPRVILTCKPTISALGLRWSFPCRAAARCKRSTATPKIGAI